MPSILTLDGGSGSLVAPKKARKKKPPRSPSTPPPIGTCKKVHNPRTRKQVDFCFVGRSPKAPTGWRFMKPAEARALRDKHRR